MKKIYDSEGNLIYPRAGDSISDEEKALMLALFEVAAASSETARKKYEQLKQLWSTEGPDEPGETTAVLGHAVLGYAILGRS